MSSKSMALLRALRSKGEQIIGDLVQESQLEMLLKAACVRLLVAPFLHFYYTWHFFFRLTLRPLDLELDKRVSCTRLLLPECC